MPHRDANTIAHLLDANARALFDSYGAPLSDAMRAVTSTTVAAIIGYSGRGLTGSLCITTVPAVAERTYGSPAPSDWLGELANQLLGRFKADLARRGVEVFLTTPLVLKGYRLEVCANDEEEIDSALCDYVSDAGPVRIMLQYEFKDGCSLSPTRQVEDAMDVSQAILF